MQFQSGAVRPIGSIEDGWKIIGNDYWTFFSMTLITIIILVVAAVILGLIDKLVLVGVSSVLGTAASGSGDAAKFSAALIPQLVSMAISVFTNIFVGAVSGALFCGIYKALSRKANTGTVEFGDLFSGFQKIQSCLIVAAVLAFIQFIIGVAALLGGAALGVSVIGTGMLTKDGQFNPALFGGLFLVVFAFLGITFVVNLVISALTTFVYPLIGERDLSGGQALSLSVKSGFANLGGLILMILLLGLMAVGGVLVCLVGVLFVAPIIVAAIYAAYQSVFGRSEVFYQSAPPPPPIFNDQPGY